MTILRTLLVALCLVTLVGLQVGCAGGATDAAEASTEKTDAENNKKKAEEDEEEPEAVPVEVVELATGSIEETLRYSTNLEAEEAVTVFAEASRRVQQLRVEEGNRVRKGQILLRLQDDEQRTRLAKVQSQLDKAAREYDRQKRLFGQELISEQAFNDATYELEQLQLELEEAQRQLSYTEVRAPISGTVTSRMVSLGDFVTMNQPLFEMVDFNSIVARVFVPEKELTRVSVGQPARIAAPALGDERLAGEVERLAPVVDPQSGTVKVTVSTPPASALRPGMYVDVELVTAVREDALLLPKRALVYDEDQIFVYRLKGDDTVERILLRAGLEDKNFIEPEGGFSVGDQVVIAGQAGLKDGIEVRTVASPGADQRADADGLEAR
ncbi:MAG: efflux RND transporter periplasmic adaptor subunit [Acidobacteriota bacterium]